MPTNLVDSFSFFVDDEGFLEHRFLSLLYLFGLVFFINESFSSYIFIN